MEGENWAMKDRYLSLTTSDFGQLETIASMDMSYPKIRAEFYVRLSSLLGIEGAHMYEGYEFSIHDTKKDKKFTFALTGFGLSYFAEEKTDEMKSVIDEFNQFLFSEFNDLKECEFEYEHDFGTTVLGYKNGEVYEIDKE